MQIPPNVFRLFVERHRLTLFRIGGAVILCGLAFAVYGRILNAPFQFDDYDFILNNIAIRDITDTRAIWDNLSQPSRFVPFYTFALNYHFHQFEPLGYHLVNVLIHIGATLCVWMLGAHAVRRAGSPAGVQISPGMIGYLAAVLFLVHPIQTQAVSYITQRFASLAALLYLASLCCYIRGRDAQKARATRFRRTGAGWFVLCFSMGILGMFSKEFVMTLPLAILLYEMCFFQEGPVLSRARIWKGVALTLPLMMIVPAIFSFRPEVLFGPRASSSHHGDMITFPTYLLTQVRVFAKFFQLLIFPLGQNIEYDFPLSHSLAEPEVLLCGGLLGALIGAAIFLWRRNRVASFGICWFFISLSSHLVPRRYLIAEHKLYIATAGFCVGLVALLAVLIKSKRRFAAGMGLIVLTLAILTYQRNLIWRDPVLLWEDTTRKSPGKPRAWLFMGLAYAEKGEYQPALDAYSSALRLDPTLARAYHNRGKVYAQMKNYPAALNDYDNAVKYNAHLADIFNNRGNVYRHLQDYPRALSDYAQAIRLNPGYPEAYNNRGIVYKKLKQYELALADFGTAIRLDPTYAVVHNNRGNLLYQLGQREEALNDFNRAIVLYTERPLTAEARAQLAVTHLNRALSYAGKGKYEAAYADAQQALKYGYTDARRYLDLWKPLTGKD